MSGKRELMAAILAEQMVKDEVLKKAREEEQERARSGGAPYRKAKRKEARVEKHAERKRQQKEERQKQREARGEA